MKKKLELLIKQREETKIMLLKIQGAIEFAESLMKEEEEKSGKKK